jgi:hypothetical protein
MLVESRGLEPLEVSNEPKKRAITNSPYKHLQLIFAKQRIVGDNIWESNSKAGEP